MYVYMCVCFSTCLFFSFFHRPSPPPPPLCNPAQLHALGEKQGHDSIDKITEMDQLCILDVNNLFSSLLEYPFSSFVSLVLDEIRKTIKPCPEIVIKLSNAIRKQRKAWREQKEKADVKRAHESVNK